MKHVLWLLTLFSVPGVQGQIAFDRAGQQYTEGFRSGVAVMITDVNGDMSDDVVRFRNGVTMEVWLQGQEGQWLHSFSHTLPGDPQWNVTGADLNNDGWTDIVTSGAFDNVKVFHHSPFSHHFTATTLHAAPFFAQGSNLVDINNDSHLDIFVCNDVGENFIFINDSIGQFNRRIDVMDFSTSPPSDQSGNYGSVWSDFDSDGDLDLYIAKCRVGVGEPTDPRRVNRLFLNIDGTFMDTAVTYGVASGAQSWAADFADFDNDGDMDLFVANHDAESILYENIDNTHFVDVTAFSGIEVDGLPIQAVFRDFDNDGWPDLFVSGTFDHLFHNNGDKTFSVVPDPFPGEAVVSFALGDLNSDGFTDVYAIYNNLYNDPDDVMDDAIFVNTGNANNYLRVILRGKTCNTQAIGARLKIFGDWGIQIREVRAGESYGITNAQGVIFGLGTSDRVDSMQIFWPHGLMETYISPSVNRTIRIEEGGCVTEVLPMNQGPFVQCDSESFELSAPEGFMSYVWSDGTAGQLNVVGEPGIYHVEMQDPGGCTYLAGPILVAENMESPIVEITVSGENTFCQGDSAILQAPEGHSFAWSNGSEERSIVVSEPGTFDVTVTRNCSDVTAGPVTISVSDPDDFTFLPDTIENAGSGTLIASGDSINWYANAGDTEPAFTGTPFVTPHVSNTRAFYVENITTVPGLEYTVGMAEHAGNTLYNADQFNGTLMFDVHRRFRLDSVQVTTDFPGLREVQIIDSKEEVVFQKSFSVVAGSSYLPVGAWVDTGEDYRITTNADTNNAVFGTTSPQLVRSNALVDFPYTVEDIVSITKTEFDNDFYYYFYNWHITTSDTYCYSARYPVEVVVDSVSRVRESHLGSNVHLYPNPVRETLHIDLPLGERIQSVVVTDIRGSVCHMPITDTIMDVRKLSCGVYFVRIAVQDRIVAARFLKI